METFDIFSNENLGSLRVIYKDGEPWFVSKDVCDCLNLTNSRKATTGLLDDEKADVTLSYTSSNGTVQKRNVKIVSESGLYTLIMRSRKDEALVFQRWITREVLPSIRKNGAYVLGQENMSEHTKEELFETIRVFKSKLIGMSDYADTWENMYFALMKDYAKAIKAESEESYDEEPQKAYVRMPDGYIMSKELWDSLK